jgi:hypothetical protein
LKQALELEKAKTITEAAIQVVDNHIIHLPALDHADHLLQSFPLGIPAAFVEITNYIYDIPPFLFCPGTAGLFLDLWWLMIAILLFAGFTNINNGALPTWIRILLAYKLWEDIERLFVFPSLPKTLARHVHR